MREIKFRAWDKTGECMVPWNAMTQTAFNDNKMNLLYDIMCGHRLNVELMQYTGLKDKNGKEIYEGDIIKTGQLDSHVNSVEWRSVVKYENEKAMFTVDSMPLQFEGDFMPEVIGNIYEEEDHE
ncbi:MAG: YopX family protein [Desulfobacterales bacterium]